ncbi:MAG: DUF4920 domain-containing protein [Desulfuromonas sp.]|nr:MAG: DUF4920 domain-containing protein [Desulfuromonas sp.]
MRTFLLLLAMVLLMTNTVLAKSFGNGVSLAETTAISSILDQPEEYLGKQVKVSGLIVDVCARRGCWIYVAGDRPYEKIRVKVTDGEIVFPLEARGKQAEVEGVVEVFELTREQVLARSKHHAEEQGIPFDPASVTTGERVIRLRGLGAEIPGL